MVNRADPFELYMLALNMSDAPEPDYGEIFKYLQQSSAGGEIRAKYAISSWYLNGIKGCVRKSVMAGFRLLCELEDTFIAEALFDLAVFYDLGQHIEEDENKAFSLYMRAALLGHKESCQQIAEYYREGRIVTHDEALNAAWLTRSQQEEVDISPPYRIRLRP